MEVFAIAASLPQGTIYIKSLLHTFAALQIINSDHLTTRSTSNPYTMSNSGDSSNSVTPEEANQQLVNLLHRLEGTVAQALRLQHTPGDRYAREASMNMAVEIAYTLVSHWRQLTKHLTDCPKNNALQRLGPIATVVPPRLLSMGLAVFASQAGTGQIVDLPDWTREWSYDPRYRGHPLYRKTLQYREVSTTDPSPAAPAPAATAGAAFAAAIRPALAAPPAHALTTPATLALAAPPAPSHAIAAPAAAPSKPTAAKVKPTPIPRKPKPSQVAVTFDAPRPRTPPQAGPSRKRTFSGSSSNKESGQATTKRRKFTASPKAKISTRTGRRTRASKVSPAKSKRVPKSKEMLIDTDDEGSDKVPAVPAAKGKVREYIEILEEDEDDDAEEAAKRTLPTIVVGKKMKKVSPSLHWTGSLPHIHLPVFF